MWSRLGIDHQYERVVIRDVRLSNGRSVDYTFDFILYKAPHGDETMMVEIKPCYPYDDDLVKCRATCTVLRRPVLLMYNTTFAPPFCARWGGVGMPAYDHSDAVRGMLFVWEAGQVVVRHDVAYMYDETARVGWMGVRENVGDERFDNPTLQAAYAAAAAS